MDRDIVSHGGEQRIALVLAQFAAHHRPAQKDFQIHFMVGRVDAGGIVDRIGVDASAGARIFDAAKLGHAQIGAFAHHLGAHFAAVDTHGIVGAVAGFQVGS